MSSLALTIQLLCAVSGPAPLSQVHWDWENSAVTWKDGHTGVVSRWLAPDWTPGYAGDPKDCEIRREFTPAFGVNPDTYRMSYRCPSRPAQAGRPYVNAVFYALTVLDGASRKGLLSERTTLESGEIQRVQHLLAACGRTNESAGEP